MIKNFLASLDQKYLKICVYSAVTVLITVIIGALAFCTGPFWSKLWAIFSAVIKPVIIGGIICYLLLPAVNKLEELFNRNKEHGWARPASVLVTFLVIALLIIVILGMLVISIYKNVESLNLDSMANLLSNLDDGYEQVAKYLEQLLESFNISSNTVSAALKGAAGAIKNFFSGLLFGVIFAVYFLLDVKNNIVSYWERACNLLFGAKQVENFKSFLKDADNAFSGYIRGQLVDAAIVGTLSSIALSIAGVPYSMVIGIIMGFGNLIPYFGPILGYAAFIDGNVINPKLLSDNINVHPLLVVAALLGGGVIGGIAGMLVAVPTAALLKLQFDRHLQKLEDLNKEKSGPESAKTA